MHFMALRNLAQERALKLGLRADVHGHTERTKVGYLAHVLPGHVFDAHAIAGQDAFHDSAVAAFTLVADADDSAGPAAELAAADRDSIVDLEVGLCTSGGNAPDDHSRPCNLGITACFTCPNGWRTVEHIPGLLAAVEVTHIIETHNVEEWDQGEAQALRCFAQATLNQFPPMVVENVRRNVDLTPHIHTVTGMYLELRHG